MSEWIVFAIYLSFVLDFLFFPIPSEASTRALSQGTQGEQMVSIAGHAKTLMWVSHGMLLLMWLLPLLLACMRIFYPTPADNPLPFAQALAAENSPAWVWTGIAVAIVGRLATLRASQRLRQAAGALVQNGLFAYSRHPIVVGLHLTLAGLLLSTASIWLLPPFLLTLVYFDFKIDIEEQALLRSRGREYRHYMDRCARYITLRHQPTPISLDTGKIADPEEQLTLEWLNQRQPFDDMARDESLLQLAIEQIANNKCPVVADLGSGTGNLAARLHPQLQVPSSLILVEQHQQLLLESQRRLKPLSTLQPGVQLQFVNYRSQDWLAKHDVDLITNNALLDLFTRSELAALLSHLAQQRIPMYSSLNYCGIEFNPRHDADAAMIHRFEQHMSRPLDRGRPLGATCTRVLRELVEKHTDMQLIEAASDWQIPATEIGFLFQNLGFYADGISALAEDQAELEALSTWLSNKHIQIETQQLTLTVRHIDFLLLPGNSLRKL